LRTFLSVNGVEWSADAVCVFDGLQNVIERCVAWYDDRLSVEKAGELVREDVKDQAQAPTKSSVSSVWEESTPELPIDFLAIPKGVQIIESEPIIDRKSTFVGRACRISHPSQVYSIHSITLLLTEPVSVNKVPLILSHLMSDRRISRAAHPIIHAYRCQVGTLLHQGANILSFSIHAVGS
jgi:hypothetical protein